MTRPEFARVAALAGFGAPLEVREVPIPSPVEPGAILVQVECATVCGTDVHLWQGELNPSLHLAGGYVPGHECVGVIVEFGPGSQLDSVGQRLAVGDRIIWANESCGECYECSVLRSPGLCGRRRGHMTMPSRDFPYVTGTFADYSYVLPRAERVKVPDQIRSEWASAASCALRTVMHIFERLGRIAPGEHVLIQGAGSIGLFCVAEARRSGAAQIIVVGGPRSRLDVARLWGADHVVPLTLPEPERAAAIRDLTAGAGPDILIEASGASAAFAEGLRLARPGARYVLAGGVAETSTLVEPGLINRKQLTVLGTWAATASHYYRALRFLEGARHVVDLDLLIGTGYELDSATDALVAMQAGTEIKPVIYPMGSR